MLDIRKLSLITDEKPLITDFSCSFEAGQMAIVLGPNGSGKTSLLRCLGLFSPEGRSRIFHKDRLLSELSIGMRSRLLSWLPSDQSMPFDYSVSEILLSGRFPWHQGFPGDRDRDFCQDVLRKLRMTDIGHRKYHSLSSGEQKKVMAGRILCQNTPVMILDEPCAHLDISISHELMELFKEKSREGHLVIMSLHQPELALRYGDFVVLIGNHEKILSGPVSEVCTEKNLSETYGISARIIRESGRTYFHTEPLKDP